MINCLFIDIDNNGFLDSADFECMALRACIIEGKGDCNPAKLTEYQHIMRSLWDEISDLADFDKVSNIQICIMQILVKFSHESCLFLFLFLTHAMTAEQLKCRPIARYIVSD